MFDESWIYAKKQNIFGLKSYLYNWIGATVCQLVFWEYSVPKAKVEVVVALDLFEDL